jgi:hypothetical protein
VEEAELVLAILIMVSLVAQEEVELEAETAEIL